MLSETSEKRAKVIYIKILRILMYGEVDKIKSWQDIVSKLIGDIFRPKTDHIYLL